MKWGNLYDATYVNVLFRAVQYHLSGPFTFVCLTDDPEGLDDGILSRPIPDIGLKEHHWKGGGWPKLSVFLKDLYGMQGRALFIDLDMMIVGDLDPCFEFGQGLVAINHGAWSRLPPDTMSSIFAFDIGEHTNIVEHFQTDPDGLEKQYGYEQTFIHQFAEHIEYWPQDWMPSYKRHLRQPLVLDRFLPPRKPSSAARVVVFHGDPRPRDLATKASKNPDRFPHSVKTPVPWVRDYWQKFGGLDEVK